MGEVVRPAWMNGAGYRSRWHTHLLPPNVRPIHPTRCRGVLAPGDYVLLALIETLDDPRGKKARRKARKNGETAWYRVVEKVREMHLCYADDPEILSQLDWAMRLLLARSSAGRW